MPDLSALRAGLDDAPPDDRTARMVLADTLDSEGQDDPRGAVLRAACGPIHEQLGCLLAERPSEERPTSVAFPDRLEPFWTDSPGWETVGRQLEVLAAQPPADAEDFRRQYEALIRGNVPLNPEDLEATLRLQYDLQVRLLNSLNLLENRGITAVDGKRYPLPSFEDVLNKLQTAELQRKITQGFDTLLLVPFGLPLNRLLDAWRDGLRRNAATLRSVGEFNQQEPLWLAPEYRTEALVYDPRSFTDRHGGYTKEQHLAIEHRGFDVLLVEGSLANLPRAGQGQPVGSRSQIECGRSPEQYRRNLPEDEVGLTPEAYIIAFLDALERRGQVLDQQTSSYLLGAYLPSSRHVPYAFWHPEYGQANLRGVAPGNRNGSVGRGEGSGCV